MKFTKFITIIILSLALTGCGWFSDFQLMLESDRKDFAIGGVWAPVGESTGPLDEVNNIIKTAQGSYKIFMKSSQKTLNKEAAKCKADKLKLKPEERDEIDCSTEPNVKERIFETYRLPNTGLMIIAIPGREYWTYYIARHAGDELTVHEGKCETGVIPGFIGDSDSCRIINRKVLLTAAYQYINSDDAWMIKPGVTTKYRRIKNK